MKLNISQPLTTLLISVPRAEIGSSSTKVAVVALFALTLWMAAIVPSATFLARLPKWILVLMSAGLLIAQAIFTFGSPLAGLIYWSSCSLAAVFLLPLVAMLLLIGLFRSEPPRFVVPQIGLCFLLGILCFITR